MKLKILTSALLLMLSIEKVHASSEVDCLAKIIYHESRGQSDLEKRSVGTVVLNRRGHGSFPKTVCGVMRQPRQFSWYRKNPSISDKKEYKKSKNLAHLMLSNNRYRVSHLHKATFFHSGRRGFGNSNLRKLGRVGDFVFYRIKNR